MRRGSGRNSPATSAGAPATSASCAPSSACSLHVPKFKRKLMSKVLIKNADYVVTVDSTRRMIRDGAVAIDGDRIAFVGKSADVPSGFAPDEIIDGKGKLVMPGLIDTH